MVSLGKYLLECYSALSWICYNCLRALGQQILLYLELSMPSVNSSTSNVNETLNEDLYEPEDSDSLSETGESSFASWDVEQP